MRPTDRVRFGNGMRTMALRCESAMPDRSLGSRQAVRTAAAAAIAVGVMMVCGAQVARAQSPGACSSVLLAGSSWLGGSGVDVKSNGVDEGSGASCGGTSVVNGVVAGSEWQCVELVNRLYLSKGWISSTWRGNGGRSSPSTPDSMYDEAPGSFAKQPNGSISYIGPGDVISINISDGGTFVPDGHVLIANTSGNVTSGSISLVSENSGAASDATPVITGTLSGGTLTIPGGGGWAYNVIGVVHAPGGSGGLADGAFVSHDGFVYRIAGGAPIYVSNWAAVGGPQPTTALSDAQFAALPRYPRDGTFLDASGGGVFIVAGGAPLYLSNWAAVGGPKPGVAVDEAAIDNAGGGVPWDHLRAYPADGTFLDASGGGVFIVAGGAPLYLSSWAAVGGPKPGVAVDEWDVDNTGNPAAHLRTYPADGTFINTSANRVYRFAGGASFLVSNWSVFGGAQRSTTVDQWDVDNDSNPAAHVRSAPVDGTIVEGLPSGSYWSFASGHRSPAGPSSAAVAVDEIGLAAYSQSGTTGSASTGPSGTVSGQSPTGPGAAQPSAPGTGTGGSSKICVVPRLLRMTVAQARHTLRQAGCRLGRIDRPRHPGRGHVLRVRSQSIRPGSKRSSNTAIEVTVK